MFKKIVLTHLLMLELRSICLVQHTLVKMALEDLNHLSTTNNCAKISHSPSTVTDYNMHA